MTEPLDLDAQVIGAVTDGDWDYVKVGRAEFRQLIAAARRLEELESALTFLLHARDPDFDFGTKTGAQIELQCAVSMGWDPKAKDGR